VSQHEERSSERAAIEPWLQAILYVLRRNAAVSFEADCRSSSKQKRISSVIASLRADLD
jgi:hypothetical protein